MKRSKWKIYLLISMIIVCIGIMCFLLLATPVLKLKGKNNISLEVFSEYKEEGATARTLLKNLDYKIKRNGEVNTNQIGTYKITYSIETFGLHSTLVRFVNVVDTKAPVLELKGNEETTICPNQEYEEEGYHAYDNYDGNLTEQVKVNKEKDLFIYQVADQSKNETKKKRKIKREDKEAPIITLKGDQNMVVYLDTTYEEPGYEAMDNCEGSLIEKVVTEGSVDTTQLGTYHITYQVEDSSGNQASVTRVVTVKERPVVIAPDNSTVYLTFDDGPSSITPKVLDILKKYNVKATFFVINHSSAYDSYIKRAYEEGHTVAVHSYTHNYKQVYTSEEAYLNDFNLMRNKIYNITGEYPDLFRFPGGSSNTVSRFNPKIMTRLTNLMESKGYVYFDWNIDSNDAGGAKDSSAVYRNVTNNIKTFHSYVVLMHDFEGNYKTLNALEDIIVNLKNRGYQFDRLTKTSYRAHHSLNN